MQNLVILFVFFLTIGSAAVVAFSPNLIYSAFALIGTFLGVAMSFVLLSADFVGLAQVMVYAGGILILTVFAVMLTAKIEDSGNTNPVANYKAVVPLTVALIGFLSSILMTDKWAVKDPDTLTHATTITDMGNSLLTDYLLPFELISILLLMSMVGAAIISRRHVKGHE